MVTISNKIEKILDDSGMLEQLKRAGIIKTEKENTAGKKKSGTRGRAGQREFSLEEQFELALSLNQCKYQKEEEKTSKNHRYYFDYQGGHFIAVFYKPYTVFELMFLNIVEVDITDIDVMRSVVNHFNNISIHHRLFYSKDPENKNFVVHVSMTCDKVEPLDHRLESFFGVRRDFDEAMTEGIKHRNKMKAVDLEVDNALSAREAFLINQQELTHQQIQTGRTSPAESITLGSVIDIVSSDRNWELKRLTVVVDDRVQTIDDNVAGYELQTALGQVFPAVGETVTARFEHRHATLLVETKAKVGGNSRETFTITLTADSSDNTSLYYRVQVLPPALLTSRDRILPKEKPMLPQAFSFLVAYDLTDPSKKLAEFDYMWKDAQLKSQDKNAVLTDEEQLLCQLVDPSTGFNMYWGRRYFSQGRYYEALRHFESFYRYVRMRFFDVSNEAKEVYFDTCFYIGFCYNELGLFEKAYFYLDQLRESSRITHCMELINTLVNVGDIRSFNTIDNLFSQISEQYEDQEAFEEEATDTVKSFVNFMRRRRAFACIDFGDLDHAEKEFKALLDDPESHDYAIGELAYIKRLRELNGELSGKKKTSRKSQNKNK